MLTVLFATKNRASILERVLECYCSLNGPEGGWKLVVVDNGSTDLTLEVLASFTERLPLQVVSEQVPGKNRALNAGLDLVEGDLIIFSDDDAFPSRDWLTEFRRAADQHLECSIFGGPVTPYWEASPPGWLNALDLGPIFTITPSWMEEGELSPDQVTLVQGPNMAIRAGVFEAGIRFNPDIGPRGSSYPMGSETEILLRLSREGHRAWHIKRAPVEHFIRKEQLQKPWILKRAFRYGRGWYRLAPDTELLLKIPRRLFRQIPREVLVMIKAFVLLRPDAILRARWQFHYLCGQAREASIIAEERKMNRQFMRRAGHTGDPSERASS